MKKAPIISVLFLMPVLAFSSAVEILKDGPFSGVDLSLIEPDFRLSVREANEDCVAVEGYRLPTHAKAGEVVYFDGGTRAYFGRHYRIIVRRSMLSVGDFHGYSYGYELYLGYHAEKEGALPTVSRVWAVSSKELEKKEANSEGSVSPERETGPRLNKP